VPEPLLEGLDLGVLVGEWSLELVDAGLGGRAVDGKCPKFTATEMT
jgi:hypothetical protein